MTTKTQSDKNAVYAVTETMTFDNGVVMDITPASPYGRVSSYLGRYLGYDASGHYNFFHKDDNILTLRQVSRFMKMYATLEGVLTVIATERVSPTNGESLYAGGVVSPGNKIFTAVEQIQNAFFSMNEPGVERVMPGKYVSLASEVRENFESAFADDVGTLVDLSDTFLIAVHEILDGVDNDADTAQAALSKVSF